jgi:hypothetical protein
MSTASHLDDFEHESSLYHMWYVHRTLVVLVHTYQYDNGSRVYTAGLGGFIDLNQLINLKSHPIFYSPLRQDFLLQTRCLLTVCVVVLR